MVQNRKKLYFCGVKETKSLVPRRSLLAITGVAWLTGKSGKRLRGCVGIPRFEKSNLFGREQVCQ